MSYPVDDVDHVVRYGEVSDHELQGLRMCLSKVIMFWSETYALHNYVFKGYIYIYIYISVCVGLGLTLWQLRLMFGQEKMGFKVEEKGPGPSTPDAFYAIAGCKTPTNPNDRGCREQTTTYAPHMPIENQSHNRSDGRLNSMVQH